MRTQKFVRKTVSLSEEIIKAGTARGHSVNRSFSNYVQDLISKDIQGDIKIHQEKRRERKAA